MAAPNRATIALRLRELLNQLSGVKSKPFYFAGEPAFETWRDDVVRWLGNAGAYAKEEGWSFSYVVFVGQRGDLNRIWQAGIQKAEGILQAVIENVENDWSESQSEPEKPNPPAKSTQVFIGHGHTAAWKDIRDFVAGRLGLEYQEFNSQPQAGKSTKERLEEMLSSSAFALIIMTAEDETKDGKVRARENVVHEAGLFQGKLGFERAIILREEGCEEFSNIKGLVQIEFPRGNIMAVSEEVRRTLEREGLISKTSK